MVRATETTPAGVTSVHPQPLPESPDGEHGTKGDEAGGQAGDGVGDTSEDELAGAGEFAVDTDGGGCVTHLGAFQLARTMMMEPTGAVA